MDASYGRHRASKQKPKKKLLTTVGPIVVHKDSLLARTSRHFSITPLLQEYICRMGQEVVFSKASEFITLFNQVEVSSKQVDRVCNFYGDLLHKSELSNTPHVSLKGHLQKNLKPPLKQPITTAFEHLKSLTRPGKDVSQDYMYAMVDGSFLQCRSNDETHKDVWKEIKVGRIFLSSHQVLEVSKKRNIIRYSDYVVSLGKVKSFLTKMENRLDDYKGTLVFINDGASWIWNWIEDAYPDAVQILDYYHAMEYLAGFADTYFKDTDEKKAWIESMEELLNQDKVADVIEQLNAISLSDPNKRTAECKEKLKSLLSYYNSHKNRMLYGTYRQKGYLVGSGPIESAHRNVIQKRLKLSGQRWTEEGAQNIACLRACSKSMRNDIIQKLIKAA